MVLKAEYLIWSICVAVREFIKKLKRISLRSMSLYIPGEKTLHRNFHQIFKNKYKNRQGVILS